MNQIHESTTPAPKPSRTVSLLSWVALVLAVLSILALTTPFIIISVADSVQDSDRSLEIGIYGLLLLALGFYGSFFTIPATVLCAVTSIKIGRPADRYRSIAALILSGTSVVLMTAIFIFFNR